MPVDEGDLPAHLQQINLVALDLKRHLELDCKAAWCVRHKIMRAMAECEGQRKLGGVQIDDAYLGGERQRGSQNKHPFVIAVQVDENPEHPALAVIEPMKAFDNASLKDSIKRHLELEREFYSDRPSLLPAS